MSEPVIITLNPIPNQQVSVVLDEQNCTVTLRQLGDALYMSLVADGVTIFENVLCNNGCPLPAFATSKFKGHLLLVDTVSDEHPSFDQLGERFVLIYDND